MLKKGLVFLFVTVFLFSCSKKENHYDNRQTSYDSSNDYGLERAGSFAVEVKKLVTTIFKDIFPHKKNVDTVGLVRAVNLSENADDLHHNLRNLFEAQKDLHTIYFDKQEDKKNYGLPSDNLEVSSVINNNKEYFIISKIKFTNNYNVNEILQRFKVGDIIVSVNDESPQKRIANILENNLGANAVTKKLRALDSFFESKFPMSYRLVVFRDLKLLDLNIPSGFYFKTINSSNSEKIKDDDIYQINNFDDFSYIRLKTFKYDVSYDNFVSLRNVLDNLKYKILSQNKNKLIIDVRNNGGGYLELADTLAYLFYDPNSNKPFFPMHYRLKATNFNLNKVEDIIQNNPYFSLKYNIILERNMLYDAISNNNEYTENFPMISNELLNTIEPGFFTTYAGKEIYLLTNSNCYSGCDSFVAVLKDQNLVTKVIGEDAQTGGGGASILYFKNEQENISNNFYFQTSWEQMQSKTETGFRLIEGEGTYADCVFPKDLEDFSTYDPILNDENYIKRVIQKIKRNEC